VALTKTARVIIASASLAVSPAVARGTLDLETTYGGLLTLKITNGATGPTAQCVGNVLVAHNATVPAAGAAGADWKTHTSMGGGTTLNAVTEMSIWIPPVMALEVEFTGNTGQAVTVEAHFSELSTV